MPSLRRSITPLFFKTKIRSVIGNKFLSLIRNIKSETQSMIRCTGLSSKVATSLITLPSGPWAPIISSPITGLTKRAVRIINFYCLIMNFFAIASKSIPCISSIMTKATPTSDVSQFAIFKFTVNAHHILSCGTNKIITQSSY